MKSLPHAISHLHVHPHLLHEDSADTHHDHIHRSQDQSETGPRLALGSASRRVWHSAAQHFENVAQRSAKLPGQPILRPVAIFRFILAFVYMDMVCVCTLLGLLCPLRLLGGHSV